MLSTGQRSVNIWVVLSDFIGYVLAVSLPFNCVDEEFTSAWFRVRLMAIALVVVVQ